MAVRIEVRMPPSAAPARPPKTERIGLRATARQGEVLRRAAEATDSTMTDFVLDSAVDRAQQVLADRRWFVGDPAPFDEFVRMLDAPLPSTEKFDRLFSRPSPFAASV
jgi:uncharacterized protein (DUF1778 family)